MLEMRVVMVMNLNGGKLHRFLYCSHIEKSFASQLREVLFLSTDEHR